MATVAQDLQMGAPDDARGAPGGQGAPAVMSWRGDVRGGPGAGEAAEAAASPLGAPAAEPSDGQLVERVRRGDPAAFDALVRRHDRRAFALAYRLMAHREDAEDVVQESFVAALEALDRFDAGRPFGPWLYRIVVNRSLNARKARSRRTTDSIPDDVAAGTASPDRAVEMLEARARLLAALAGLPERQRMVIEMIELEGFSGPEVAEVLGIPEGTVRWHLHGARKALRAALGSDEGGAG